MWKYVGIWISFFSQLSKKWIDAEEQCEWINIVLFGLCITSAGWKYEAGEKWWQRTDVRVDRPNGRQWGKEKIWFKRSQNNQPDAIKNSRILHSSQFIYRYRSSRLSWCLLLVNLSHNCRRKMCKKKYADDVSEEWFTTHNAMDKFVWKYLTTAQRERIWRKDECWSKRISL